MTYPLFKNSELEKLNPGKKVIMIARIRKGNTDKKEVKLVGNPNAKQRQAFLAHTLYVGYGGA